MSGAAGETMVVVDGVVHTADNVMANLDPSTIDSIEVVRGAAAVRLYGGGAESGVIIITTRR
jgi:outer membrane receptor protein involved in Fe transport